MKIVIEYLPPVAWPRPDGWTVIGRIGPCALAYDGWRQPHLLGDGEPEALNEDDFLSEMGMIGAFGTNAEPTAVTRLFGKGANLAKLATGQCVTKLRGEESSRRVVAWEK